MNLIKNPFASKKAEQEAEDAELQAKKERIEFHRTHVRNGPAKFKQPSNGQLRRAQQRGIKSQMKKVRRSQVRQHFEDKRFAALTRGHLTVLGEVGSGKAFPQHEIDRSAEWILAHFAQVEAGETLEVSPIVVADAIKAAKEMVSA